MAIGKLVIHELVNQLRMMQLKTARRGTLIPCRANLIR
jgi:hypothetical protein